MIPHTLLPCLSCRAWWAARCGLLLLQALVRLNSLHLLQVAHLTVVGPLREGLVPVVGTVGDQRVHGRVSLSKIQNPSPIPPAAQTLSSNYDAPIHLHVIIHPNGHIDGMPVALKDAATAKILRTLVNKFGGDSHSIVLDGDLRRYPQVMLSCGISLKQNWF
jgi:hypothetical protein